MSRTLPWRSGGRLASVVWRMGEASGNLKSPAGDGVACYRGAAALTTTTYSVTRRLGPLERYSRGRSTHMRSHARTAIVLIVATALLALFLYNVDLRGVVLQILHADVEWLLLALARMFVNLAVRAWRWQYLLEPLGAAPFGSAFRATA